MVMKNSKRSKQYLRDFLKIAPLSHAIWRAVEALSFGSIELKSPVLDLGCGFGEFSGVVFDHIEMGIDINRPELAQALKGKKYKKVEWADARKMPFKNSTYNTVVSVSVMEHISHSPKVLTEVHRVLKKDGLFVFSVPTPELNNSLMAPKILKVLGMKDRARKYIKLHKKAFKHVNLKNKNWWTKELKKANFEVLVCHGTLSPTALRLHELFLITAFPSQLGKLLFGKRLIMSVGLRSKFLPIFFSRFIVIDKKSQINLFFVARKI